MRQYNPPNIRITLFMVLKFIPKMITKKIHFCACKASKKCSQAINQSLHEKCFRGMQITNLDEFLVLCTIPH